MAALLGLIVLSLLAGCSTASDLSDSAPTQLVTRPTWTVPPPAPKTGPVVASVNGETITLDEVMESVAVYRAGSGVADRPEGELRKEALIRLINTRLLLQEAYRQNISVAPTELYGGFRERARHSGVNHEDELEKLVTERGDTIASVQRRVYDRLVIAKLIRRNVSVRISNLEDEVADLLARNREKLEVGLLYRAHQIMIAPDAPTEAGWESAALRAAKVHDALRAGGDFAELARAHSQDDFARDGGALGVCRRGERAADIEAAILRLSPGQTSSPHRSTRGYYIFRLEDREELSGEALAVARRQLSHVLSEQKYEARYAAYFGELKQRAVIEIHDRSFADVGAPVSQTSANDSSAQVYADTMYEKIYAFWSVPCVERGMMSGCTQPEAKVTARVDVHADGRLAAVTLQEPSGVAIYDAYILNAVKLASPFGPVPKDVLANQLGAAFGLGFTYRPSRTTLPLR